MADVHLIYMSKIIIDPSRMNISMYLRRIFQLLYLLVSLNILFFLIIYNRLILVNHPVKSSLLSPVNNQTNDNSVCFIPRFDPWDQTVAKSLRIKPLYRCPTHRRNLIDVVNSTRLMINQNVNKTSYSSSITHCIYMKINRNPDEKFFRDWTYSLTEPILMLNGFSEEILDTDFVLTRCYNNRTGFFNEDRFW